MIIDCMDELCYILIDNSYIMVYFIYMLCRIIDDDNNIDDVE